MLESTFTEIKTNKKHRITQITRNVAIIYINEARKLLNRQEQTHLTTERSKYIYRLRTHKDIFLEQN